MAKDKTANNNNKAAALPELETRQGRKPALIAVADFPKAWDGIPLTTPAQKTPRTIAEVRKFMADNEPGENETIQQFTARASMVEIPGVTKTIGEMKQDGVTSFVPVSLGSLRAGLEAVARKFILDKAANKGDLGYLIQEAAETPAAEVK